LFESLTDNDRGSLSKVQKSYENNHKTNYQECPDPPFQAKPKTHCPNMLRSWDNQVFVFLMKSMFGNGTLVDLLRFDKVVQARAKVPSKGPVRRAGIETGEAEPL